MSRPASGQVLVTELKQGRTYALRFRAYGRREHLTLGTAQDGWTRQKAELELQNILADVRRGIWRPPEPSPAPTLSGNPTFHVFASQWFESRRHELRPRTLEDYRWSLIHHLLPFFHAHHLDQITVAEVDRYRTAQLRDGTLNATSINETITRLAQILDVAIEYHPDLMRGNPARGRRRRVKSVAPQRGFLEADQLAALLQAAGELDARARSNTRHVGRRAILSTLALAGLRIGELTALRWRDVDLAAAHIQVRDAKTAAGTREVNIGGLLRDDLALHRAGAPFSAPDDHVFTTATGAPQNRNNVRNRVLHPAIDRANAMLLASNIPRIENVTLHALRRTYISLLLDSGENPRVVMQQVGHAHPELTLRIYAQVMQRREQRATDRLDALIRSCQWAETGRNPQIRLPAPRSASPTPIEKPSNSSENIQWAVLGSNQRPPACKAGALTS